MPRQPLSPSDHVIITQLERYNTDHACDLCGRADQSPVVVLCHNRTTGQSFHAARDCLRIHFGLNIERLEAQGKGLITTLDGLARTLALGDEVLVTSLTALDTVLEKFDSLKGFDSLAHVEAKGVLTAVRREESQASSGKLDSHLRRLRAYVLLQQDFRRHPQVFNDRWTAIHQLLRARREDSDLQQLTARAVSHRETLTLEEFYDLYLALGKARKAKIILRNEAVKPWCRPTREDYLSSLHDYYSFQASLHQEKLPRFKLQQQAPLGARLLTQAQTKKPYAFALSNPYPLRSPLDRGLLPNQDKILTRGARIAYAPELLTVDLGKNEEKELVYLKSCIVYYPDAWSQAYALWHKYGGDKGRELLEKLDESDFQFHTAKRPTRPKRARPSTTRTAKKSKSPSGSKPKSPPGSKPAPNRETAKQKITAAQLQLLSGFEATLDSPLSHREKQRVMPFTESAAREIVGAATTLNVSAIKLFHQECDAIRANRANLPAEPHKFGLGLPHFSQSDSLFGTEERVHSQTRTEKNLPRINHPTKTPLTKTPLMTSQRQSLLPKADYVVEGDKSKVEFAKLMAVQAGLTPLHVRGSLSDTNNWKAQLTLDFDQDGSPRLLENSGWIKVRDNDDS